MTSLMHEYEELFRVSFELYDKFKKDSERSEKTRQMSEILDIYLNSAIGLLREGYPRQIKDDKIVFSFKINNKNKPFSIPVSKIKEAVGDEYDIIMGNKKADENQNAAAGEDELLFDMMNESASQPAEDDENWEDLPLFFDEGDEKNMDDFVYSEIRADLSDTEKGHSSSVVFDVYPERIPRNKEDKIKTVVVVKGSRNSIFIGEEGCTTKFKAGDYTLGARVSVEEDGTLGTVTLNLNHTGCNADFKHLKDFKSKIRDPKNSHMILKISGDEVHVFPVTFGENDKDGNASSVALVGEERAALIPSTVTNILPVVDKNDVRHDLKVFWQGSKLKSQI